MSPSTVWATWLLKTLTGAEMTHFYLHFDLRIVFLLYQNTFKNVFSQILANIEYSYNSIGGLFTLIKPQLIDLSTQMHFDHRGTKD